MIKDYGKVLVLILLAGCRPASEDTGDIVVSQATIEKHIAKLASDEFLGRMPFTEGEVKTLNWRQNSKILAFRQVTTEVFFRMFPWWKSRARLLTI